MKNTLKLLLLLLVLGSCSNENESIVKENVAESLITNTLQNKVPGPPPVSVGDIYTVETEGFSTTGLQTAKLRKNNVLTTLSPNAYESFATHVAVANNGDVYVAGAVKPTQFATYRATVWKNGSVYYSSITDGNLGGGVNFITTKNNDVYFASYNKIYKNNILLYTLIDPISGPAVIVSNISIFGSDVYISGNNGSASYRIKYIWKNGIIDNSFVCSTCGSSDYFDLNSMYVDASGVYVVGTKNNIGKIWKNGVEINIPTSIGNNYSNPLQVTGDTNNIYIVGDNYIPSVGVGRLWKMNKITNNIITERAYPNYTYSVFQFNGVIYVGGNTKIWADNNIALTGIYDYKSILVK